MALVVEIANRSKVRVDAALIRRAAKAALGKSNVELSIALLDSTAMRTLNKRVLGHDYVTDVISFDHGETPEGHRLLELAICPAFARQQARELDIPVAQELARYVVHGCLHLVGHDDTTAAAKKKMWAKQEQIVTGMFA